MQFICKSIKVKLKFLDDEWEKETEAKGLWKKCFIVKNVGKVMEFFMLAEV